MQKTPLSLLFIIILLISCGGSFGTETSSKIVSQNNPIQASEKIGGVSFVSPSRQFPSHYLEPIKTQVNANWVALSPFGFSREKKPAVNYNSNFQWWGEKPDGIAQIADYAKERGLKIMMKPQVWMMGSWVGSFDMKTEEKWQEWEQSYEKFILEFAQIAQDKQTEIFCIGTEYRIAAVEREAFWRNIIKKVKTIYKGKITYAANWDNFENVKFWDELDYIGIDSYFPLVEAQTPQVEQMVKGWEQWKPAIEGIHKQYNKPILFTEYGYMSCDYTAWQNWENEGNVRNLNVNMEGQKNAFEAFFRTFWNEDWFAGGFIWKWYDDYEQAGGASNKQYTPQRKAVESTIKNWYGQ